MLNWRRIASLAGDLREAARGANASECRRDEDELQKNLDQISAIWFELWIELGRDMYD